MFLLKFPLINPLDGRASRASHILSIFYLITSCPDSLTVLNTYTLSRRLCGPANGVDPLKGFQCLTFLEAHSHIFEEFTEICCIAIQPFGKAGKAVRKQYPVAVWTDPRKISRARPQIFSKIYL